MSEEGKENLPASAQEDDEEEEEDEEDPEESMKLEQRVIEESLHDIRLAEERKRQREEDDEDEDPEERMKEEQKVIEESLKEMKLDEERKTQREKEEAEFQRQLDEVMKMSMMSAEEENRAREYNELRAKSKQYKDLTYKVDQTPVTEEDTRPLYDRAVSMSVKIQDSPQTIYKLEGKNIRGNEKRQVRRLAYGPPNKGVMEKTILIVGETGSGKSTLIDCMVNYLMGAKEADDPARFRIVDVVADEKKQNQTESQTDWITCYSINKMDGGPVPFNLNLIDTPGFGDTRGMKRDGHILHQIQDLFETVDEYGIECLDAVCIVIKATVTRLTATQKYIFDSLMTLFGKDLEENMLALGTFDDGSNPAAINSLRADGIPFKELFPFNNAALGPHTPMRNAFWEIMMQSWKKFFTTLDTLPPKSLTLSVEVLHERELLQDTVAILIPQIKEGLHKMHNLSIFINESKGQHRSDSTRIIEYTSCIRKKEDSNYTNTNCEKCKQTCVRREVSSTPGEICKLCGCCSKHLNENYAWQNAVSKERLTIKQLMAQFKTDSTTSLSQKLEREYQEIKEIVEMNILKARTSNTRLHTIALRPEKQSVVNYVDLMIVSEKQNPTDGWMDRIAELEQLKAHYTTIGEFTDPGFEWTAQTK